MLSVLFLEGLHHELDKSYAGCLLLSGLSRVSAISKLAN